MLKRFCSLLILVLLIGTLSGCSNTLQASLSSEFSLSVGQSARITSEAMDIKFIDVTEDSRCPRDVQCIWAGRVSCDIEITKDGSTNTITLTDTAGSGSSEGITYQNYKIIFSVSPYPAKAEEKIAKGDYRLSMTVNKSVK